MSTANQRLAGYVGQGYGTNYGTKIMAVSVVAAGGSITQNTSPLVACRRVWWWAQNWAQRLARPFHNFRIPRGCRAQPCGLRGTGTQFERQLKENLGQQPGVSSTDSSPRASTRTGPPPVDPGKAPTQTTIRSRPNTDSPTGLKPTRRASELLGFSTTKTATAETVARVD